MNKEVAAIEADAIRRAPIDTGELRRSTVVQSAMRVGGKILASVGFDTDYAVFVHERTELNHTIGEAKFLENAIKARANRIGPNMAREVGSEIGSS